MKKTTFFAVLTALLVLTACRSTPESVPQDLKPRDYFRLAQEAVVERRDYDTALLYYRTFLERYPDDIQRAIEAEYEIAFIRYKQNDPRAEQLFSELLARYEEAGAELLPGWPKVLAEKLLKEIAEEEGSSTAEE
ncbi:MAG: hypothetical protein JW852_04470 [Spirochaetales bacterium]|nr:hypothetical protein [Spirochaetales bacterium]